MIDTASPNHERILIADDELSARQLLRRLLESEGYLVEEAQDGAEALQQQELWHPDLLLIDVLMPTLDGFEVCKHLQTLPKDRQVPVIMITTLDDQDSIDHAFQAGADDYLTKPISWPIMRQRVRRLLLIKRLTTQLAEERDLLRTLIDTVPDPIYVKDAQSHFLINNRAHLAALGVDTQTDTVGKSDFDFFPREQADGFWADDQAIVKTGEPLVNQEELATDHASGQVRWYDTTKAPLRDASGRIVGLVGISHDISELKKAQDALTEERNLLLILIDNIPDNIFVKDTQSRILIDNVAHRNLLRVAGPEDSVGKTDFDFFSSELASRYIADEQAIIQSGQPLINREEPSVDPVGNPRWLLTTKVPLRNSQGEIVGIVGVNRDITERQRMEEKLAKERTLLRTLIDNMPDSIYAKDAQSRFILNNIAHAHLLSATATPEDLLGKSDFDFFPQEMAAQFNADEQALIHTGQALINHEEQAFDSTTGVFIWNQSTKVPLLDSNGTVIGLVGISRDITERKLAEEALRESEIRYHSLFDNMLNGLAYCKMEFDHGHPQDFMYLEVNLAFESLTGLTQVVGKKVSEVIPGIQEADPGLFEIYGRVALTGQPEQVEFYVTSLGMWFSISLYSPAKEYFVAVFDVITERKRAEETLRASEAAEHEQRVLAEALRDTAKALVTTLDPDAVMIRILENVGRVVPHQAANIRIVEGQTARVIAARGYPSHVEEAERQYGFSIQDLPNLQRMIQTGDSLLIIDTMNDPNWVQLPSPELRWARSSVGVPIKVHGQVIGFLSLDSDTPGFFNSTHLERLHAFADHAAIAVENAQLYEELRQKAQELEKRVMERTAQLQRSKERVEAILNSSSDGLIVLRADGTISQVNPTFSQLFGYQPDEVTGHALAALAEPESSEQLVSALTTVFEGGTSQRIEIEAYRKDCTLFGADVGLSPILGRGEWTTATGVPEVVCSIHDITERKRVERELQELNRMKTEFLSIAAHELRTPLTTIQGFSEVLLTRDMAMDRMKHYLKMINDQSLQLRRLIDALLDISRLESKRGLALDVQPVNLAELVEKIVSPFIESSPQHRFQCEGLLACPVVQGDPFRLGQVLQNLLANAVKYSPRGGTVTIRGQVTYDSVTVSVTDEGIGMTPDQQVHLFERFYRADASNTATGGTGLGLAISKLIIELHGGQMQAESRYGIGSTFSFTLPLSGTSQ